MESYARDKSAAKFLAIIFFAHYFSSTRNVRVKKRRVKFDN
jgi:hypothetical protein